MSYRKKHHPPKPEKPTQQVTPELEFKNSGVLRSLPLSVLNSGLPYQRPVRPKWFRKLFMEWDERLLAPPIVSFRDGKFNVVDGQHRIAVIREKSGGKNSVVQCLVFDGMTYEQEADLCYRLDKGKRLLSISQSTNALVESAADPAMLNIRELMQQHGFTWALGKARPKEHEVVATQAVIKAYQLLGSELFGRMFWLLDSVWHGDLFSVSAAMISGMSLFLKTYETELDDYLFVQRMTAVTAEEIVRRSRTDFSTNKVALRVARVILTKFNRSHGKKLPYRFKG